MDTFLARLSELIGSVIKPNQLMLLVSILSGVTLLDPWSILSALEIKSDTQHFRFWIVLAFALSSGLILLSGAAKFIAFSRRHVSRIAKNISASRLHLSDNAKLALHFLHAQTPDAVTLASNHPAIRELRRSNLIEATSYIFESANLGTYQLTEPGITAFLCADVSGLEAMAENDKLEILNRLTGSDITGDGRNSWMAH